MGTYIFLKDKNMVPDFLKQFVVLSETWQLSVKDVPSLAYISNRKLSGSSFPNVFLDVTMPVASSRAKLWQGLHPSTNLYVI